MRDDLICWLDLETTGLDPVACRILEIGMILTDYDLNEVDYFHRVVACEPGRLERMEPTVQIMHRTSGLLNDVMDGEALRDVHADAMDWLARFVPPKSTVSAGFTVGFDRSFLAVHMAQLHQYMSHRMIDVSTIKTLKRHWRPDLAEPPAGAKAHRSLADCREAMAYLKHMREAWLD